MSTATIRIATRGSLLAVTQAGQVARALEAANPGLSVELLRIRSAGDEPGSPGRVQTGAGPVADKSRFVKEVDDAVLSGEADLAVHSAKDLPGELMEHLAIVAVPQRVDPRDVLCGAERLDQLAVGARVGTASLRRRAQLLAVRRDLCVLELRGNVDTRLRRLREHRYAAVVLAAAGLERLGIRAGVPLRPEIVVPAIGQGCLAIEARVDDERAATLTSSLEHAASRHELTAERALARTLGATCLTPLGAWARCSGDALEMTAFVGLPDGTEHIRMSVRGSVREAEGLGYSLGRALISAGAAELLGCAEMAGFPRADLRRAS